MNALLALIVAVLLMPAPRVAWSPNPGAQVLFLSSPFWETAIEGNRGGGKTQVLLADFAQHCGPKRAEGHLAGYGPAWRGILFRRTFPELEDVIAKTKAMLPRIFPGAEYNIVNHTWKWPTGEELLLRHMRSIADYDDYHGHEYPFISWEELGTYASPACYDAMKSCSRSATLDMPRKVRATFNPAGVGHNWLKARFIDPAPAGVPIRDEHGNLRVRIHSDLAENKPLLAADPDYRQKIAAAAAGSEHKLKAWLEGDWDIVAGGMFDDVFDQRRHVLAPFALPESWRMFRAFDWGSSKPFSVGWWAITDGSSLPDGRPIPRGSFVRFAEWYGWNGSEPNVGLRMPDVDIARGILEREKAMKIHDRVVAGPADSAIFFAEPGKRSIADAMADEGVAFIPADKRPGSRKSGWEVMRRLLSSAMTDQPEDPGLYVVETCRQWLRTVPVAPRDEKDPDDLDTDAEDHAADESRYAVTSEPGEARLVEWRL